MKIDKHFKNNYHINDHPYYISVRLVDEKLFISVLACKTFEEFCDKPLENLAQLCTHHVPEILITIRKAKLEKLLR